MIKVLDTNVILLDHTNLFALAEPESILVLPETVIDEIDSKKSLPTEIGFQARAFGRYLSKATSVTTPYPLDSLPSEFVVTAKQVNDLIVCIVSSSSYPKFDATEEHSIRNDRKILHIASAVKACGPTVFYTNDLMCGFRAESIGLTVSDVKEVDNTNFVFNRTLTVSDEVFRPLHCSPVKLVDPEWTPGIRNYTFINEDTNQTKLAVVGANGCLDVIGKDTEKRLRDQLVPPVNAPQLFLSYAIQDSTTPVVICESVSGTGKTLAALSNAMKLVRQPDSSYTSIYYFRASINDVGDDEYTGYVKGDQDTKLSPYFEALYDSLEFIVRSSGKLPALKGQALQTAIDTEIDRLVENYNIVRLSGLGMRGRTLNDCILIVDEAQNQTKPSFQKVLTRIGRNCKLIIIGSNSQIDSKYVTRYNNGLSTVLQDATDSKSEIPIHAVTLTKIVRSPISEWAERLFTKSKDS